MKVLRAWATAAGAAFCIEGAAGAGSRGRNREPLGDACRGQSRVRDEPGRGAAGGDFKAGRGGIDKQAIVSGARCRCLRTLCRTSIRAAAIGKNPGFAGTAILMLALGICATVSIFAFVDAALLKPLPYRDPAAAGGCNGKPAAMPRANLSYPDYLDWKRLNTAFSSFDVYQWNRVPAEYSERCGEGSGQDGSATDFFEPWASCRCWVAISMPGKICRARRTRSW